MNLSEMFFNNLWILAIIVSALVTPFVIRELRRCKHKWKEIASHERRISFRKYAILTTYKCEICGTKKDKIGKKYRK